MKEMFKIIHGDFPTDKTEYRNGGLTISTGWFSSDRVKLNGHIKSLDVVTEENKQNLLAKAGWGTLGAVALGPIGLIAGLFMGGKSKATVFLCVLDDGRRFMAEADAKTYGEFVMMAKK
jgi:hypothetical protein